MNCFEDQTQSPMCKFDILEHFTAAVGSKGRKHLSHSVSVAFRNIGTKVW